MKSRIFLILLLFIMYGIGTGWYYVCKIKQVCSSGEIAKTKYITFQKNSEVADFSPDFELNKKNILDLLGEENKLIITGMYDVNETNTTAFDNLGIARAMSVQNKFTDINSSRIKINSATADFGTKLLELDGVKFRILTQNAYVKESENGATLYISDSTLEHLPAELDAFFTFLANENKNNIIELVGHTDSDGDEGENFEEALQRANAVKSILIEKGVDPSLINANSKGETEPVYDNASDTEGPKNNRIEVLISE